MKNFLTEEISRIQEIMGTNGKTLLTEGLLPTWLVRNLSTNWTNPSIFRNTPVPQRGSNAAHTVIEILGPGGVVNRRIEVPQGVYNKINQIISNPALYDKYVQDKDVMLHFWDLMDETIAPGVTNKNQIYYDLFINNRLSSYPNKNEEFLIKQLRDNIKPNDKGVIPSIEDYLINTMKMDPNMAKRVGPELQARVEDFKNGLLKTDIMRTLPNGNPNPNYRKLVYSIDSAVEDFRVLRGYTMQEIQALADRAKISKTLREKIIDTWNGIFNKSQPVQQAATQFDDIFTECQRLMKSLDEAKNPQQRQLLETQLVQSFKKLYTEKMALGREMDSLITKLKNSPIDAEKKLAEDLLAIKANRTLNDWTIIAKQIDEFSWGKKFRKSTADAFRNAFSMEIFLVGKVAKLFKRGKKEAIAEDLANIAETTYVPNLAQSIWNKLSTGSERGVPWSPLRPGKMKQRVNKDTGKIEYYDVISYDELKKMGRGWSSYSYFVEVGANTYKWQLYLFAIESILALFRKNAGNVLKTSEDIKCFDEIARYMVSKDIYDSPMIYEVLNGKANDPNGIFKDCPDCYLRQFKDLTNELVSALDMALLEGEAAKPAIQNGSAFTRPWYWLPEVWEIAKKRLFSLPESPGDFLIKINPQKWDEVVFDLGPTVYKNYDSWEKKGVENQNQPINLDITVKATPKKIYEDWIETMKEQGFKSLDFDETTNVGLVEEPTLKGDGKRYRCYTFSVIANSHLVTNCPEGKLKDTQEAKQNEDKVKTEPTQTARLGKIAQALKAKLS